MSWVGDAFAFALVLAFFLIWGWIAFRRWLVRGTAVKAPHAAEGDPPPVGEGAEVLKEHGYVPIHGKRKIPVTVRVDDRELSSRLFIDYFAKRGDKIYAVKLSRGRKPVDVSAGSSIREHLLVYALLYEDTAGVLYVDVPQRRVYKISFELEL